jgi:hypothetical protein
MGENKEQVKKGSSATIAVITGYTVKEVVRVYNESAAEKGSIITLIKDNGQFMLLYYK